MYSGNFRENPADLPCYRACLACSRCEDNGRYARCSSCSGRNDPHLQRDPYDDRDKCRCSEGILQVVTKDGRYVQVQYQNNPYSGKVRFDEKSQDEREYESYVEELRDRYDNETFDPVQFEDGSSTTDWSNKARGV